MTEDWYELAACKESDPNLFIMDQKDDVDPGLIRGAKGLPDFRKLRHHNQLKMAKAAKVCAGCPVVDQCSSSAHEADLYWSVRGGELPLMLQGQMENQSPGKPPLVGMHEYLAYQCPSGHSGDEHIAHRWTAPKKGAEKVRSRYCMTCYNEKRAAREAARSGKMEA